MQIDEGFASQESNGNASKDEDENDAANDARKAVASALSSSFMTRLGL